MNFTIYNQCYFNGTRHQFSANWSTSDAVKGTITDGRAVFRVNRSDHNNEYGTYRTHIYAYDKSLNRAKYEVPDVVYEHTVSFDANGGTGVPESIKKYLGADIVLPEASPARDGYVFMGYSKEQNGGADTAAYQPGGLFTEDEDTVLYAVWKPQVPDAVLPADLERIEEEAFCGSGFMYVQISSGTERIGNRAFADCADLKFVYIPPSVETIANDAFENTPDDLVIIGEDGSYAEYYAYKRGFEFRVSE